MTNTPSRQIISEAIANLKPHRNRDTKLAILVSLDVLHELAFDDLTELVMYNGMPCPVIDGCIVNPSPTQDVELRIIQLPKHLDAVFP